MSADGGWAALLATLDDDVREEVEWAYRQCHRDIDVHSKLTVPFGELDAERQDLWRRHARHRQHCLLNGCDCPDETGA